jgi:hypothetical protein
MYYLQHIQRAIRLDRLAAREISFSPLAMFLPKVSELRKNFPKKFRRVHVLLFLQSSSVRGKKSQDNKHCPSENM